ncbi:zinc-binding alcohol dehydrogenase family protein [Alteromonas sp. 345S023]|uniref:Zinc-type alcohol dehydrogenase-like protein n=1 Tax=Alteromonas profundi TaxID=2696062 RepID=A0A7X5RL93_9ALTE|nr:zinc-binding alcohol dehydrogenase family protein [Alteromonas profundi]NDV91833.1 zinc-binding alcohol dehydrogenase family protein [Alteromonas profundi]
MKAIGYKNAAPIVTDDALVDIELELPVATGRDLLINVRAIAVNPVDFKIRQNVSSTDDSYKVLGWDAVGEVVSIGDEVELFSPGDLVYYAGDLTRHGSNAQYQLVDERLVAHKPARLSDAEAAAMPLTTITAWELLFDHLAIKKRESAEHNSDSKDVLLVVGASGGVGSILVQLAKQLTNATVIATASRPSSQRWVEGLGADYVIDHSKPLVEQISALNIDAVTHVASLTHTDSYLDAYVDVLKPMGKIALTDDPDSLDVMKLKTKSISLHWEFMFTRSMFKTHDMVAHHALLTEVATLIDNGAIKTTVGQHLGTINAKNLLNAHTILASGSAIGKLVLEGF